MLSLSKRILILAAFGASALGVYKGIQFLVRSYLNVSEVNLLLPGEADIPFLPLIYILYSLVYIMPCWVILSIKRKGRMAKTIAAFCMALIIHFMFFVFMPVEYVLRPEILPIQSFWSESFHQFMLVLFTLDDTINTFPSMHVSFAIISYFIVKRYWPQWAGTFLILAIATSLSTVLVKQHYILDGVSALALAMVINYFFISKRFAGWPDSPANLG